MIQGIISVPLSVYQGLIVMVITMLGRTTLYCSNYSDRLEAVFLTSKRELIEFRRTNKGILTERIMAGLRQIFSHFFLLFRANDPSEGKGLLASSARPHVASS